MFIHSVQCCVKCVHRAHALDTRSSQWCGAETKVAKQKRKKVMQHETNQTNQTKPNHGNTNVRLHGIEDSMSEYTNEITMPVNLWAEKKKNNVYQSSREPSIIVGICLWTSSSHGSVIIAIVVLHVIIEFHFVQLSSVCAIAPCHTYIRLAFFAFYSPSTARETVLNNVPWRLPLCFSVDKTMPTLEPMSIHVKWHFHFRMTLFWLVIFDDSDSINFVIGYEFSFDWLTQL